VNRRVGNLAGGSPYPPAITFPAHSKSAAGGDWMPLGVLSLVQGDQSDTNTIFQSAVNKSGAIAGNYSNALTGTTQPYMARWTSNPSARHGRSEITKRPSTMWESLA
jgi:hypothetical protein